MAQRRRADVVLLAIAVLLVGVITTIGAVAGNTEQITGMWTSAEISSDGSARVTEVIDYDFGRDSRHGIFRDIPYLSPDAAVNVSSATAPDQFELIDTGSGTRIRIGDPSRTIRGRHRYRIQYSLDGLAPAGRLAWDAVGTSWPVEVNGIEIHVVAPFELTDPRCAQGPAGSTKSCDVAQPGPGHLVTRIDTLQAGEGATLYADAGRSVGDPPPLPAAPAGAIAAARVGPLVPGLLGAGAALIVAVAVARGWRRRGRKRVAADRPPTAVWGGTGGELRVDSARLESSITPGLGPPQELTPAQGGILLAEGVRQEHKVAWLIGAAMDGYLEIEGDEPQLTLVRRANARIPSPDPSTAALLDQAFAGRDRLYLGTYDPCFASAWKALGTRLEEWQRSCGLWDPAGERHRRRSRVLGAIAAPLGLALAGLGGAAVNWPDSGWQAIVVTGAVIAGAGLAALICAWELRVRTPAGSALWLRVESWRRSLAESGAQQADEANERGQLGQYNAWAVALGEIDCWSRAVTASTVPPSSDLPMYYPSTARALSSATSTSSRAPSSSGGGSGGGGSGGGGGGGGGGSW